MTLQIRDAKLTDKAPMLVLNKRTEMFNKGYPATLQRGQVVNKLLNEYADLLEKIKERKIII